MYNKIVELREQFTHFVDFAYRLLGAPSIDEVCEKRGYISEEMKKTLHDVKVFKLDNLNDLKYFPGYGDFEKYYKDWGLLTESGEFILKGRYCVPIRDIQGRVTAVVGWYPDQKKYVTTPTLGFVRDAQFFNIESYALSVEKFSGITFLVEGIFDTLSIRSLGIPCLGNMGLPLSGVKQLMLSRWKKVCAIPDNDRAGKSTRDEKSKNFWRLKEVGSVFVLLPDIIGIKDVDDLAKSTVPAELRGELFNIMQKGNYLYKIKGQ